MSEAKKALIKQLVERYDASDVWIDSVPRDIQPAFFDNEYMRQYGLMIDALIDYTFQDDERGWVYWILFDWRYNKSLSFSLDSENMITCDSIDTLLDLLFTK
jgi:hypothetical protein